MTLLNFDYSIAHDVTEALPCLHLLLLAPCCTILRGWKTIVLTWRRGSYMCNTE